MEQIRVTITLNEMTRTTIRLQYDRTVAFEAPTPAVLAATRKRQPKGQDCPRGGEALHGPHYYWLTTSRSAPFAALAFVPFPSLCGWPARCPRILAPAALLEADCPCCTAWPQPL